MSYKIKYKDYAEALYAALKEDTFYITMEKSLEDQESSKEAMLKYLDYSIVEGEKYGNVFMPGGNNIGISVWAKPLAEELEAQKSKEKKEFLLKELGDNSLKTYNSIVKFMSEKAESLISSKAWYLSIIGILPSHQGRGFGPELVNPVLAQADRFCIPTYLETFTPRNKTFYTRLGYETIGVFLEPTTNAEYSIMRRDAQVG